MSHPCFLRLIHPSNQYNHMPPISKTIKLAGVAFRAGLHKLFPFLFAPPVFFMVQVRNESCMCMGSLCPLTPPPSTPS